MLNPKIVVKATEEFEQQGRRFWRTLFLGGGISNCPDWQTEMESKLTGLPLVLFNPRRDAFDMSDPSVSVQQIEWEHRHLRKSSMILFWRAMKPSISASGRGGQPGT